MLFLFLHILVFTISYDVRFVHINRTGFTSEAGSVFPPGTPDFTPVFVGFTLPNH
jgi:hypothetical protein